MSGSTRSGRWRGRAVAVAYRTETGVRERLSQIARRRGWVPAVLPYAGYAADGEARVLGRVVLAPSTADPRTRRGIPGYRRLLTLECPAVPTRVELDGGGVEATTDHAGVLDARLRVSQDVPPGRVTASITVEGRDPVPAHVYVAAPGAARGVVCDIDDTVWITGLAHPLAAARRTLLGTSSTRRSVPGMARLLRAVADEPGTPVVYLSNGPWNLAGPAARFLERHGFPPGALLMTDWGVRPDRWFRDGRAHKASALATLVEDLPQVRWVLVGDDGEDDPHLYCSLAEQEPEHVAAVLLRQVPRSRRDDAVPLETSVGDVPVLRGADGDELLPRFEAALGR